MQATLGKQNSGEKKKFKVLHSTLGSLPKKYLIKDYRILYTICVITVNKLIFHCILMGNSSICMLLSGI